MTDDQQPEAAGAGAAAAAAAGADSLPLGPLGGPYELFRREVVAANAADGVWGRWELPGKEAPSTQEHLEQFLEYSKQHSENLGFLHWWYANAHTLVHLHFADQVHADLVGLDLVEILLADRSPELGSRLDAEAIREAIAGRTRVMGATNVGKLRKDPTPELKQLAVSKAARAHHGVGQTGHQDASEGACCGCWNKFAKCMQCCATPTADEDIEGLEGVKVYKHLKFENWGDTVQNAPIATCWVESKAQVVQVVNWARLHGRRARVSGFRHSWTDFFSQDNHVLVAMASLAQTGIPSAAPADNPENDLRVIEVVSRREGGSPSDFKKRALVRVGAAVSNEEFRQWAVKPENLLAMPMSAILTEVSFGGLNAPMCHGSGIDQRTVADQVFGIEFVNADGKLVEYTRDTHDADLMNAVAGSLGLFGVVVSLTLHMDAMQTAVLTPVFEKKETAVPRPGSAGTAEQDNFEMRINNSYYNEFFWFPFEEKVWVNCWRTQPFDEKKVKDYPPPWSVLFQNFEEYFGQLGMQTVFKLLPEVLQAKMFAKGAMAIFPSGGVYPTQLTNALHFRRGIHNMPVLDFELEIPLPPRADDAKLPDLNVAQQCWWDAIDLIEQLEKKHKAPMRITLEMRFMAGSDVLMAAQRGNKWTCSLEVITNQLTDPVQWLEFMQTLYDKWTATSGVVNARPHWAKQWQGLTDNGVPMEEHLAAVYKTEIAAFLKVRDDLGVDKLNMFSNPLFDRIFGLDFKPDHATDEIHWPVTEQPCQCCGTSCCSVM